MFHITYQFNESAILTVTAKEVNVGQDYTNFLDRSDNRHALPSDSIISIVPVRHVRRRATKPQVTPQ